MPMKNPVHPGHIVRSACLEPLGLSVTAGAKVLGVTRQALNNIVNGKSGISPEMAIRLRRHSAARRRRGCRCSLPTTSQPPAEMRAKSRCAASTSRRNCTRSKPGQFTWRLGAGAEILPSLDKSSHPIFL
jgi:addiction module HigA family antidote